MKLVTINIVSIWVLTLWTTADCYWKFPGLPTHSKTPQEEEKIFLNVMSQLKQQGAACNSEDNESALKEIYLMLKTSDVAKAEEKILSHKGNLCRFDLTVCDEYEKKCECNMNAIPDGGKCRIRIGWPCSAESTDTKHCMDNAGCKPWEGSFNYDTEDFPQTTDFFTDGGKHYCRCLADESDCGETGGEVESKDNPASPTSSSSSTKPPNNSSGHLKFKTIVQLMVFIIQPLVYMGNVQIYR